MHPRLEEIVTPDLFDLEPQKDKLASFDACFFCLGVSSLGMKEPEYSRVTYELTLSIAKLLLRLNPQMVFVYVSGAGTDSTESGKLMWARVKGRTENALVALGFKGAYMFRPGIIQPMHDVKSKTRAYRVTYDLVRPLFWVIRALWPRAIVTSVEVGRGMLGVARRGYPRAILEVRDIQDAAR
jgi:uncharacterized protein YbjT (DUF2867 family)